MTEEPTVDERIAALEARVAALESTAVDATVVPPEHAAARPGGGMIHYEGQTDLHGHIEWEIDYSAGSVLGLPLQRSVDVLAALGHPVRQGIVRRLLHGPVNAADLQEAVGLTSPGQLYHHLKTLTAANLVEQRNRGDYRIAGQHVVPILVILLASSDVAGDLGT